MDWIDRIEAEAEQDKQQAQADAQEAVAASLLVARESPEFMRQLKLELDAMVAKLPKIGVEGSISDASQPDFETRYYIHLRRIGLLPKLAELNLFHRSGSLSIRCHPLQRKPFELRFAIHPDGGVAVCSDNHIAFMKPGRTLSRHRAEPGLESRLRG
jgi:hypothetical protein